MTCVHCKDTGWIGYERPMTGADGKLRMMEIPQVCACRAGDAAAARYEQNLKAGRAGFAGEIVEIERKRCADIVRSLIEDEGLREHVASAIEMGATMASTDPATR